MANVRDVDAQDLFSGLPQRYDLLAEILSFGQNRRWRHAMVDAAAHTAPDAARVLDVATGTAGVALYWTDRAGVEVTGVDLTEQMLRRGRENVVQRGREDRIRLLVGRAEQLPFPDATFDAVTFTYLLRYVEDPAATLVELARVLKPGGALASLEFAVPPNPGWHAAWVGYTRGVLPLAGRLTGGPEWARVGSFLGPSISGHYEAHPVQSIIEYWQNAGIRQVRTRRMSLGGGLVMCGRKPDAEPAAGPDAASAEEPETAGSVAAPIVETAAEPEAPVTELEEPVTELEEPVADSAESVTGPEAPTAEPEESVMEPEASTAEPEESVAGPEESVAGPEERAAESEEPAEPEESAADAEKPVGEPGAGEEDV
ncbi:MAG TPA: class I SAM-dependent methyltransferase [Actinospica sp.]|nr:class I SAM-dependent methyltransferase [Actinospica sp.]